MIYGALKQYQRYLGLSDEMDKALQFLATAQWDTLADGRYEIDGDTVFVNLFHFDTKPENPTPEGHCKYIDVQYMVEGEEFVTVAPLSQMKGVATANPEGDIWLYEGTGDTLTLCAGRFMIFWPEDAHAPGISCTGSPTPARKAVVKVKVS